MKSSSVRLLLGVSVLLLSGPTVSAVSLSVRPNLQQLFSNSKLTLRCDEEGQTADGWTVKRTAGGETKQCGNSQQNFGRIEGSSCIISTLFKSDSGVYWCENSSGKISEHINITVVTGGQLILEVPALPVLTGSDVTLRCRFRDGSTPPVNLLKNGERSRAGLTGELNISNVQQSDEGFYSCSVDLTRESPRSMLRVKVSPSRPSRSSATGSITTVLAVLGSLVLLVLLLVAVLLLWRKQTGETDSCPPADTTYADITITQTANRREKHPADPETVYSGVKTHTAGTSSAVQKKRRSQRERGPDPLYSAATLPPGTSIAVQKKRRSQRERGPDPLYSAATLPPGPDDVTYSQVVIRGQGSAGVRPAQPDVVYSSVRSGK